MENLKDRSTAELLAEWERLDDLRPIDRSEPSKHHQQCDAIAAELDRRCDDAGIYVYYESFAFDRSCAVGNGLTGVFDVGKEVVMYAADLRDLLTWLLMKGGNG